MAGGFHAGQKIRIGDLLGLESSQKLLKPTVGVQYGELGNNVSRVINHAHFMMSLGNVNTCEVHCTTCLLTGFGRFPRLYRFQFCA